jgi:predicted ATPase/class 3 adenylate cyclase
MAQRPTGTVTFLFTDIEGSTRLWEQHPEQMRHSLALHDEILEREIDAVGGFVHSTAGDAYSAAFSDPANAIGAAVAAQRALREASWPELCEIRVRMAVHTGVAHERGDHYYGPALNRCARILSSAHGGQIVISRGTEQLVQDRLSPGTTLKDLGEHQLRDLGHPEHLFQIIAPGLTSDFGALRTLDPSLNNLPLQLTSFIGREDELDDVRKRLADTRLLTLTGVGGSGKTRLALQVAADTAENYPDGVWLVELAAVSDPERLASWVAESLKINRSTGVGGAAVAGAAVPVVDQIVDYLRPRRALLILDNCEHLIAASADLATYLLRACPDIKILATSREGLGIAGETLWQVPSLEMPSQFEGSDLEGTGADALRLFAERATSVNPNFEITAETYPIVLKICRRLDGMPLAIELAAARSRSLDIAQIANRLDDRFRLLTGGSRTALPRQQTLAAAVEWSYELLQKPEQIVFQRLAAFRGGFTLEAAERVCVGGVVDQLDVVDHLSSLVDKSMVVWEGGHGDRYRLLETLRQYAMEQLKDAGEADEVRQRHAEYFLEVAEEAAPHLRRHGQVEWLERLEADHENFRSALAFTDEHDQSEKTARIAAALSWFWNVRNHREEQREWLGHLLGRGRIAEERTVLELMLGYAWHLLWSGQSDQLPHLQDTIGMAERLDDRAKLAEAWVVASWMQLNVDDYEAADQAAERAVEIAEESQDGWAIAWALYSRGWMYRMRSNVDAAVPYLDKATTWMRKIGDTLGLSWSAGVGAILARYRLDYPTARRFHEESLEGAKALGDKQLEAFNYACIGIVDFLEGRYDESISSHQRANHLLRDIGAMGSLVNENLDLLAKAQLGARRVDDARDSFTEALAGLETGIQDNTVLASVLESLASPLLDSGEADLAGRFWGWATATREEVGRAVPPPSRAEYQLIQERIRGSTADPDALAAEGATWSYEQAVAEARQALQLI